MMSLNHMSGHESTSSWSLEGLRIWKGAKKSSDNSRIISPLLKYSRMIKSSQRTLLALWIKCVFKHYLFLRNGKKMFYYTTIN